MKSFLSLGLAGGLACFAQASPIISSITPFAGDATESFDGFTPGTVSLLTTSFGTISDSLGEKPLAYASVPGVELTGKSGFAGGNGSTMGGMESASTARSILFTFTEPVDRFGALWQSDGTDFGFGTVSYDITLRFTGVDDSTTNVSFTPNGTTTLQFFGFQTLTTFIKSVEIVDAAEGANALAFDDVRVGFAPVPEPASLAVLGLGLAALKRRRKNG